MDDHVTLLRRDVEPGGPVATERLPSDLLDQVRRRVQLLSALLFVAFSIDPLFAAVAWIVTTLSGGASPGAAFGGVGFEWIDLGAAGLSAGLWGMARRTDVPAARLHTAGLVYMVVICFVIALTNTWQHYLETGLLPYLTWVPAMIILFPLVLPGRPRRMLLAALGAASSSPAALAVLDGAGRVSAGADDYANASVKALIAVMFAYMGARVVHSLGREVAAARELGSYRLERRLGEGGMGEVWLARHRMLARPAAIKLIRTSLIDGAAGGGHDVHWRFEREAQVIATLRSPHTIDVFDFGVADDGRFYYAMELLDGLDADTLVRRHGIMPPRRVAHVLRQACHSLSEAHARGLVHRDVKPANVFICRYGEELDFVKLLDFGLVKSAAPHGGIDHGSTAAHVVQGTPAFMAPEQALGRADVDGRADLYALGCVAYWLLTGSLVFEGDTPMTLLSHHARTPPGPPSAEGAQPIPAALDRLVLDCLAKDPGARPQSARELADRLAAIGGSPSWTTHEARGWWERHMPAAS